MKAWRKGHDEDSGVCRSRRHSLGVGVRTGGLGEDELERSGAYRVYSDPLDLLNHLDELGIRYSKDS